MPAFAKARDKNEKEIVNALREAGAHVTRMNDFGIPDLLVGFKGRTFLLEVKNPTQTGGSKYQESIGGRGCLTPAQVKWWDSWSGEPAIIVWYPHEALAAIGAIEGDGK